MRQSAQVIAPSLAPEGTPIRLDTLWQDRPVALAFVMGDRHERRQVELRDRSHEFRFGLDGAPGEVLVDPDAWLLMESRVRQGEG